MRPLHTGSYAAFGSASLGKVAAEMLIQLYLFDFYVRLLGLPPLMAGFAFGVAIIWDAVSDVIIARLLFALRKRGVQYTSLIGWGTMLLAASIFLLFQVGTGGSQWQLFIQMTLLYVLVNTGMTLIDLPQSSLSAELSHLADERNRLLGARLILGILGLILGSALPGILLVGDGNETSEVIQSRMDSALIVAVAVIITGLITTFCLRRRDKESQQAKEVRIPSLQEVWGLRRNQAFMNIIYASVVAAVGRTVNAAMALMYYRLVLNISEKKVTQIILPVFTVSIIVSIPFWITLSRNFGKSRPAWIAVLSLGVMGFVMYPVLPENQILPVLCVSVIGGLLSGSVFLVDSIITDIIDKDEVNTGSRKEALFFAVCKSVVKMSRAIAFIVIGAILGIMDIDISKSNVSQETEWSIIALFGIFVGLCFMGSGYFLKKINIQQHVMK